MFRTISATALAVGLVLIGSTAAFADINTDPSDTTYIDTSQDGTYADPPTTGTTSYPGVVTIGTPSTGTVSPDYAYPPVWHDTYALNDKSTTYHYTRTAQILGACHASTTITCTISKTTSAERTIGTSYTLTYAAAAAMLNISNSHSVSTTVSCSALVHAGHTLYAYPWGTRYDYIIHHHRYYTLGSDGHHYGITDEWSGWKNAFSPGSNDITCKVV